MSTVSNTMSNAAEMIASYGSTQNTGKKAKTEKEEEKIAVTETDEKAESTKKVRVSGRTIGNPELSEKAADYYDELRRKYGNMEFILVSKDQKEFAKANAAKYGNSRKMVVLIDEEKIEKMAVDEKYRKQYEGIIAQGASGLNQLKNKLSNMGIGVKSMGMKVNDNGAASFFATMDKSFKAQNKKLKQRREEKKAAKKAEEKKAQKAKQKEDLEKLREEKKVIREEDFEPEEDYEGEVTFMADSIDELIEKIQNNDYTMISDGDMADGKEGYVGGQVDFSV